ncbi:ankyrin repeat domain-containing protein [Stenotrophomonas maltophilia]|uniref:ankyrin repeat domain-containing protein n=1 Tax=Stenotrophomonas TaxID=40323 RepID=UPI00201D07FD|nr:MULTISPECIES: ankyrin repeat domain-containing protein [Stenotrophomonas]MBN5025619.1 ankyrin repeat domain-containing protein [Stenotrophomonas maltophilia]MDH1274024.1 ankyrin repeat domain-containing protein [Stenotrophomonas sp. GD03937]MDH1484841.1 ankyrin repeat domain-containing protein [Stenotrophomonas sp. GD03712]UQY94655.1 ankyrin repeat domain-containing protein [Stenotrophomonas maltophilia]WON68645.1 ankyrin repeat domain-containing protein [Stenotrophomonas maltophilia]
MTDLSRPRALSIAFAVGAVLALGAAVGGIAGAILAALSQPAFALGVSWWRRSRALLPLKAVARQDLPALLALWSAAPVLLALLLAWPLAALRDSGSLAAVLGLSVLVSAGLLAAWRTWPLWNDVERLDGSLAQHWQALAGRDLTAWRGLGVAALVIALAALVVLPAWPGLLPEGARWPAALAVVLLSPLLHLLLQRVAPAPLVSLRPGALATSSNEHEPLFSAAAETAPLEALAPQELTPALYEAARHGRIDRGLQLLQAGADPYALPDPNWRDQRSLAVLAAVLPDLRLLRELIARGVDVNAPHRGMTPLLAATRDSWHGRPEAVMTLLANGADSRAVDSDGNTPLHHAARSSDPGVAALLRDAAAEVDALNHDGWSPLAVACQVGNWRLARFLLERGARSEPADGTPVLLAAAATEDDDPAGVQLLLKHKARADARDRQRRSALHEAALAGHVEIIGVLLGAGANLEARDALGRTPWLEAARAGRAAVVEHLLPHKPDLVAVDGEGRNAVQLAAMAEDVSPLLIKRLVELGIAADAADPVGRRAVDYAAEAGRWAIVALLDPSYPLPAAVSDGLAERGDAAAASGLLPDRPPLTLLREALGFGNTDGMAALAKLCQPEELGGLLLDPELALEPRAVDWLLAHGADPYVRDACSDTPMFALLSRGIDAVPALQVMLQRGLSPAGRGGLARFLAACAQHDQAARGLEQLALELLERGADPFAASPAGDPPLSLAVRLGWLRLQQALLKAGVDREARDSHGMTALHLATALAREGALKLLVQHGASPEARAADGQTPLGVALSIGRRDLADWLDWRVWPLPRRTLREADLPAAAMAGDVDAVRRLIDLGFAVDAVDAQGCTALLRAAGGGHLAVTDLLLARGADPQHAAASGATPLSAAVSMRQVDIVSALLDAGAKLEHRLPGGVTVLMLASALGLPDIVARLLTAGADVHAGDAQQLGPLHCAALYGFSARDRSRLLALLDTLLLAGAEPDQAAAGSVTPLLLLLGARAEPGTACDEQVVMAAVERLLDEEVSLEVRDPRGFGPLHLAALHGLPLLVQRLLRAGADPEVRDSLNRSPREIAVMRGFIDVAGEFEPRVPGVSSMARFLRDNG